MAEALPLGSWEAGVCTGAGGEADAQVEADCEAAERLVVRGTDAAQVADLIKRLGC
jgi:hypothetical protein